jgi:hypothetical protein
MLTLLRRWLQSSQALSLGTSALTQNTSSSSMRLLQRVTLAVASFALSACVATGPKFDGLRAGTTAKATVYVYRVHEFGNRNAYPYVYIDGVKRSPLRDNGYVVLEVDAGPHLVEVRGDLLTWNTGKLRVASDFRAGEKYFFEMTSRFVSPRPTELYAMEFRLLMLKESEALLELRSKNRSD